MLPLLLAAGAAFAVVPPASAALPAPAHHVVKPAPTPPANAWHPGRGPLSTAKPKHADTQVRPAVTPSVVGLSASLNQQWATFYVTITATTNADLGPTPYYLSIWDDQSNAYVAVCGTGTFCAASVTQPTAQLHSYFAVLSYRPGATFPPPNMIASAPAPQDVYWASPFVRMTANATTVPVGGQVTLTATADQDVAPSPFYIEVYDLTTGSALNECGGGMTCAATVSQTSARTDQYIAYISDYSAGPPPPPALQNASQTVFVTWSDAGWAVSLDATSVDGFTWTITATANRDVGPTPYYLELFYEDGTFLTRCGYGTTCTYTPTLTMSQAYQVVAFVSYGYSQYPPPGIQASSNTTFVAGLGN